MFEKPQATHVLGLDMDTYALRGAVLSFARGKAKLDSTFEFPIEPIPLTGENVKPLYTTDQKEQLETFLDHNLVVTALSAQDVLVRPMELKIKKEKDIDDVLLFQAEAILPYPIETAVVDRVLLSQDANGSKLSLISVGKDQIAEHLKQWDALEIEPEVISATPFALTLFANTFSKTDELCYVLHIGWSQSLCILVDQGKLIAAQAIPEGIENIVELAALEKKIDINEARFQIETTEIPLNGQSTPLKSSIETLRISITRTIYALAKQTKGKEISNLFVTGPGATIPRLKESLCRPLNKVLLPFNEDAAFGMDAVKLNKFALSIGAALSALPISREQINFRQNEFAFPAPWKRLKQPILTYLALCIGVAIALYMYGQAYIRYEQGDIKRQYLELLNVMNRPYNQFEKEFTAKIPSNRELAPGEVINVADLTPEEIERRLQYLEKEIQAIPLIYPLLPNAPLVSDVLAWISTFPSFAGKTDSQTENIPSLQIESFNYAMIKRPDPTKKQEKYQVKVELEFSSATPKMAREFHDALIAPNDMVDPKAEIKWSSNRDVYRTSFYLKDKTIYPNP